MKEKLEGLLEEFEKGIDKINSQADILKYKSDYLGKNGELSNILKSLRDLSNDERKAIGLWPMILKKK